MRCLKLFCYSVLLDTLGDVYTCGSGALGNGNNQRQEYPMKVHDLGTWANCLFQMILYL